MRQPTPRIITAFALMALALLATIAPASARETRALADRWTVTVGFIDEPAIQADTNGLWLRVSEGDQPVTGLEQSLQVEVIYGEAVRALPLIPAIDQPGIYTSTFIPVQPGNYAFRIFGTIGDQQVNERFESAPEGVAVVDSRIDYEFPSAAQGSVIEKLAMPVALGALVLGFGIARFVSRRGNA
jgi:hypothetical protein